MSHLAGPSGLRGMKLFLLGATGKTGTHLLELALARGHEVTAFVRSPQKLEPQERLHVVAGDPLTSTALATALPGHDAVLSTFGAGPRDALKPSHLMTEFAQSLAPAMSSSGVRRLVILSAAVLFPGRGLAYHFFRWLLRHHARDLLAMEETMKSAGLSWTIARPGRLAHKPGEQYRAQAGGIPAGGGGAQAMSFRAAASFMPEAAEKGAYLNEIVGLAR
jgi:putative NADH-flavin reductase